MNERQTAEVDFERRATLFEVMNYIKENDLEAARYRLWRGFERQCRLAGLDSALKEAQS